jgi:hypothetical protein
MVRRGYRLLTEELRLYFQPYVKHGNTAFVPHETSVREHATYKPESEPLILSIIH